jgi:hypothetical protein
MIIVDASTYMFRIGLDRYIVVLYLKIISHLWRVIKTIWKRSSVDKRILSLFLVSHIQVNSAFDKFEIHRLVMKVLQIVRRRHICTYLE